MYFDAMEIVPNVKGKFFFDKNDERVNTLINSAKYAWICMFVFIFLFKCR